MVRRGPFRLVPGAQPWVLNARSAFAAASKSESAITTYHQVIGMNAITAYMGFQLINVDRTSAVLVGGLAKYLGAYGPVLISVVTATLVWTALYALYRNKVFYESSRIL